MSKSKICGCAKNANVWRPEQQSRNFANIWRPKQHGGNNGKPKIYPQKVNLQNISELDAIDFNFLLFSPNHFEFLANAQVEFYKKHIF